MDRFDEFSISRALQYWCEKTGLKKGDLAKICGVEPATVSRWLTKKGKPKKPLPENFQKILERLGVSYEEFLLGPDNLINKKEIKSLPDITKTIEIPAILYNKIMEICREHKEFIPNQLAIVAISVFVYSPQKDRLADLEFYNKWLGQMIQAERKEVLD